MSNGSINSGRIVVHENQIINHAVSRTNYYNHHQKLCLSSLFPKRASLMMLVFGWPSTYLTRQPPPPPPPPTAIITLDDSDVEMGTTGLPVLRRIAEAIVVSTQKRAKVFPLPPTTPQLESQMLQPRPASASQTAPQPDNRSSQPGPSNSSISGPQPPSASKPFHPRDPRSRGKQMRLILKQHRQCNEPSGVKDLNLLSPPSTLSSSSDSEDSEEEEEDSPGAIMVIARRKLKKLKIKNNILKENLKKENDDIDTELARIQAEKSRLEQKKLSFRIRMDELENHEREIDMALKKLK